MYPVRLNHKFRGRRVAQIDAGSGTRFLLYPQAPVTPGYDKPELVWISNPAGSVMAGPSDHRMYAVDPLHSKPPYEYPFLPPYDGPVHPPAYPGPDGNFDHIPLHDRAFLSAHVFGCVARVLDIWESYIGHHITWHFSEQLPRLELVPLIEWDNAQSGFGYLEFGHDTSSGGESYPYCLNFDVIAHEVGHSLLFSEIGTPQPGVVPGPDFTAYHEGVSDLCSLLGLLHFDTAMDRILRRASGNLYALNELNRFAEQADERQVRIVGNSRRMSDVGFEAHDRSRPFTGAFFDVIVETYHDTVVAQGLVDLPPSSIFDARDIDEDMARTFAAAFETGYELKHFALKAALADARDVMGTALARSWPLLDAGDLTFAKAGYAICDVLQEMGRGDVAETMLESLAWREIIHPQNTARSGGGWGRQAAWI